MACLHYSLSLDFLVEKPKGKYNGQKLMVLVIKNTAPRINKIVARSPAIILPRYKPTISTAITIRIVRSIKPMFFFIFTSLICLITQQDPTVRISNLLPMLHKAGKILQFCEATMLECCNLGIPMPQSSYFNAMHCFFLQRLNFLEPVYNIKSSLKCEPDDFKCGIEEIEPCWDVSPVESTIVNTIINLKKCKLIHVSTTDKCSMNNEIFHWKLLIEH